MDKTGRNDPCPCGSGRKYKKCCLARDGGRSPATSIEQVYAEVAELDALSNRVLDLIHERRFDEAEMVCRRLSAEYPDQVDGLDRLAATYDAQGRKSEAAAYYRKAVDFMRCHDGFDQEAIDCALNRAKELEAEQ